MKGLASPNWSFHKPGFEPWMDDDSYLKEPSAVVFNPDGMLP